MIPGPDLPDLMRDDPEQARARRYTRQMAEPSTPGRHATVPGEMTHL